MGNDVVWLTDDGNINVDFGEKQMSISLSTLVNDFFECQIETVETDVDMIPEMQEFNNNLHSHIELLLNQVRTQIQDFIDYCEEIKY